MVYRRKGRPSYSFQARTSTGYEQVGTGTSNKALAQRIESMWETLASTHRAWDLLDPVLAGGRQRPRLMGQLYDLWVETRHDVSEIRRRMEDKNIEPYVDEFLEIYKKDKSPGMQESVARYLRFLMEAGSPFKVSQTNPALLTARMHEYPGGTNSLRKVHSAWTVFFDYLIMPKGLLEANPMARVPRPKKQDQPIGFYEIEEVMRIIDAQPTAQRRALYALIYGSGVEQSVATGDASRRGGVAKVPPLTKGHFDLQNREFRASGTKTHTRDRTARVADWAWDIVFEYMRDMLPRTPLFEIHHSTVAHWHLATVRSLKLPEYPLHSARHHWAVRQLRAGAPVGLVQRQLGHSTAKETLDTYGRFIPSTDDRAKWEAAATMQDKKRKRASSE